MFAGEISDPRTFAVSTAEQMTLCSVGDSMHCSVSAARSALLIDPDSQKPAWSIATLDYEYVRERGQWKFHRNHCVHEHLLSPYDQGWGAAGGSHVSTATEGAPQAHFERVRAQGGKQRPGKKTRSIRGWSVPTLEP